MESLRALLPHLTARGVERVYVNFDGCGDCGSVEDVYFYGAPAGIGSELINWTRTEIVRQDDRWRRVETTSAISFKEIVESACLEWLDETNVDWYNNQGGYGSLEIFVETGRVSLNVETRFTTSENAYYSERDVHTGEDL